MRVERRWSIPGIDPEPPVASVCSRQSQLDETRQLWPHFSGGMTVGFPGTFSPPRVLPRAAWACFF